MDNMIQKIAIFYSILKDICGLSMEYDLCLTGNDLRRIREGRAGNPRGCPEDITDRDKCNKDLKDCVKKHGPRPWQPPYPYGFVPYIPNKFFP